MELRFSSALWGLILFSDCYEIEFCNLMLVNHWPGKTHFDDGGLISFFIFFHPFKFYISTDSSLPGIGFILATFEFRLWSSGKPGLILTLVSSVFFFHCDCNFCD
ncbi:hypothetical protein RchiOBHm_Chr5g0045541 [Rosa chinensis]|uniref:Uncharacterized protein n=1 Tax=Rosa chinensis TaxID=74649 RepID=A0A2P6QDW6_ROSCH|nr:hypothetical protein RchiOBHm_Chr5g0045541 [Rosa chinensis]